MSGAFELYFFEKGDGTCQVRDYLRAQPKRVRAKAGWMLERLEAEGPALKRPAAGHLQDGIFELRVIVDSLQHRILYFIYRGMIVMTNAFLKKTRAVPSSEIEKARDARRDWMEEWRSKADEE